ncbi:MULTISPECIES: PEGA domain-containing protein [unclassified Massilia]|uniref:PEGA domain-containing protein n=1 Tax=unclassified Massilia TaxID=2609279 RepID=UPI00177B2219|nr:MULTISPECIES: PEGA domain-containing protein [unclassified Massilia]MBD8530463.1 PEGA domain-containing protein [Massilia sp. CFBP 13647]MBD8674239.1 PEGA domain-containing protein [Massilia sp. CFBP 13721]
MTSQHTTIYTPFADGRPVRDIVEHTPAQVDEAWCRKLLHHTLDSLERQYATGAPHRPITPESLVMLANGDALLMPAADEAPGAAANLPADLHALALVVHYAITAELPPEGPLGPRLYDNYSEQLTKGLDCCLGPNRRLRPQSVDDMRALLGIEAGSGEVMVPAPAAQEPIAEPVTFVEPPAATDAAVDAAPPAGDFAAPASIPVPAANPLPEPLSLRERTEAGMLRKPASADGAAADAPRPERIAPAPLQERVEPIQIAPRKPSAAIPPSAPGTVRGPTQPTKGRSNRAQRWGMIAGAAIVVLAAGGALVSYMNQNDARDLVPLTLPPAERAATGLDGGETVVAPPSASAPATDQPAGRQPADSGLDATTGAAPDTGPAPVATPPAQTAAVAASTEAVVNGTTYKLLIKPWATVYVDGIERGVSPPIKRLTLAPGRHTIRVTNPNFAEHTITVDAGTRETATITYDFRAPAQ